jgi:hypothetical protein
MRKYLRFLQIFDHNSGIWEKCYFFAENWQKSQKIVIIASTPGANTTYDRDLQRQRCKNLQRHELSSLFWEQKCFILLGKTP